MPPEEPNLDEPKLGKPGAGLPLVEGLILRYWAFPRFLKRSSWEQRLRLFAKEAERIVKLVEPFSADRAVRSRRVLVPRQPGLEDSSRYWSIDMTLEHLVFVGTMMQQFVAELLAGKQPTVKADTAAVKPTGQGEVDRLAEFSTFVARYRKQLTDPTTLGEATLRHPHPWLGPLDAGGWLAIAALHQRVHRQQLEAIIAGLTTTKR